MLFYRISICSGFGYCTAAISEAERCGYNATQTRFHPDNGTDNRISVVNAPVGSKLEIFSVVGLKVREIEMKQPSGEYLVNISKGYYIIRIEETVRKVAIR